MKKISRDSILRLPNHKESSFTSVFHKSKLGVSKLFLLSFLIHTHGSELTCKFEQTVLFPSILIYLGSHDILTDLETKLSHEYA